MQNVTPSANSHRVPLTDNELYLILRALRNYQHDVQANPLYHQTIDHTNADDVATLINRLVKRL